MAILETANLLAIATGTLYSSAKLNHFFQWLSPISIASPGVVTDHVRDVLLEFGF